MYLYNDIEIKTKEDVYYPREDSELLARNVEEISDKKILEVGCGSGLISIIMARKNDVTSADINPVAVELTKENAKRNGVDIDAIQSDLFDKIDEKYDIIVFNSPYLPDSDEIDGSEMWSDKGTIERFIRQCPRYLEKNGKILIVISSLTNLERVERLFKESGFGTKVIERQKIPWEELILLEAQLL